MTFKHTKFEDSTTMRSLAKVAQEKGWIKEEPLQKTASAPKLDLKPTENLTENLLKLCAGLRAQGFEKQAEELESKFVQYKQANALYNVTKEKGEDLVEAAHPKGSHKLEGVEGKEATFEDILDKHVKMMQVVDKKPTGKLSDASQILKAVKTVLAAAPTKEQFENAIQGAISTINSNLSRIASISNSELTFSIDPQVGEIAKLTSNPTIDNLEAAEDLIGKLETRLDPHSWLHYTLMGSSGLSEDTWQGVQGLLNSVKTNVRNAKSWRAQLKQLESSSEVSGDAGLPASKPFQVPEATVSADPIIGKLVALSNKLRAYKAVPAIARNREAAGWIDSEIQEIKGVMQGFSSIPEGQEDIVRGNFEKEVSRLEGEVNEFSSTWLSA